MSPNAKNRPSPLSVKGSQKLPEKINKKRKKLMITALFAAFGAYMSTIRYLLDKRGILLISIILVLMAIVDIGINESWVSAGIFFGVFSLFSSVSQLFSINLSAWVRLGIAVVITLLCLVLLQDVYSAWFLAAFVIARFSESSNNLMRLRLGLAITHIIWLVYGLQIGAYIVVATQASQLLMIVLVTFLPGISKVIKPLVPGPLRPMMYKH